MDILKPCIQRVNLDPSKHYFHVRYVRDSEIQTYVGRFVRAFTMGSGDGMTIHVEFMDNGKKTVIDEEMWGSVGGQELSYFLEA
jgi:hypothetical protein